jgi:hypothetical protein
MSTTPSFNVTYDHADDVVYLTTNHGLSARGYAARGIEDQDGILWRYDDSGALIGATVVGLRERWSRDQSRLASEISRRFDISGIEARRLVDSAFAA